MLIAQPVGLPEVDSGKCPICEKSHGDEQNPQEEKGCLDSIPANLGCKKLSFAEVVHPDASKCTTAAHHLIPANQCLKSFKRLTQMCRVAGYDVNNSKNGMSLPTVTKGSNKDLAIAVMEGLDLQWHVSHHRWDVNKVDEATDSIRHVTNYDLLVRCKLRDLEKNIEMNGEEYCKPQDGRRGQNIINDLNDLSQQIEGKIKKWRRYFVSRVSYDFATKRRGNKAILAAALAKWANKG